MDTDPTIRNILRGVLLAAGTAIFVALLFSTNAGATQPACTGDRHYDSEANGCCPNQQECETCDVCEPVLPCPEVPACPPVTCEAKCEDGRSAPPQIIYVDRCPVQEPLERVKVRQSGKTVGPRAKIGSKPGPRSVWVPQSQVEGFVDILRPGYGE